MPATGHSASAAITGIKKYGVKWITLLSLPAAPERAAQINTEYPDVPIYIASVDTKLDDQPHIVHGLGDAGDRLYGTVYAGLPRNECHYFERTWPLSKAGAYTILFF